LSKPHMVSKTSRPVGRPQKCLGMKEQIKGDLRKVRGLKNRLRSG
jgi:hypothetical protein